MIVKIKQKLRAAPQELLWLFIAIALTILPHSQRTPLWISVLFFALALWRILMISGKTRRSHIPFYNHLLKFIIAVCMVSGILIHYGTLLGRDAGVALLILLGGMKFLEIRNERDYYIASFIGLFLILTNFFYAQSILTAIYMFFVVTVFIGTLISFNDKKHSLSIKNRLMRSGLMLLQILPLTLVIFVLFPRIPGPLWGLPKDALAGLSGISDEMSPGSISQLTLSDEVAFRVKFDDAIPPMPDLYWRGPVLWQSDGVKWVPAKPRRSATTIYTHGAPANYTVTLEATDKNWLFGLEIPIEPPEKAFFTHDLQIKTQEPIQQRRQYTLTSFTNYRLEPADQDELAEALQLPYGYHQQTIALADSWRATGLSEREIIDTALRMFNEQEFYYTLSPPLLQGDTIDEFLFTSRQGFCEHYAAAFTILMRAAGIPARIILGYQGGTINPIDNYLIVRQRDAHAWTEVWLKDSGWTRIDPTAAVSPERVTEGIENALPEGIINIPMGIYNNKTARDLWQRMRNTIDAINNRWNQWVLNYDNKRQTMLLSRIGFKDAQLREIMIGLIISLVVVFAIVSVLVFRQPDIPKDRARGLYDQFCAKLARLGIKRKDSEGPKDFAKRASHQRADLKIAIDNITDLYIAVRYGDQTAFLASLEQQLKAFKPAKIL